MGSNNQMAADEIKLNITRTAEQFTLEMTGTRGTLPVFTARTEASSAVADIKEIAGQQIANAFNPRRYPPPDEFKEFIVHNPHESPVWRENPEKYNLTPDEIKLCTARPRAVKNS